MGYVKETGQYLGEHSISLRTKAGRGSWTDWIDTNDQWHLVPSAPPVVNPPSVKTKELDNPGGDGILDLTESVTGFPLYGQRSGSWEFKLLNGWDKWTAVHEDILNTIHGKNIQVILKDDPNWYYNGRMTINEWKSDSGRNTLTLDYNFDPYKLSLATSISDDWLWDPFSFVDGIIRYYGEITVSGLTPVQIIGGYKAVHPIITTDSAMTVRLDDGPTINLKTGVQKVYNITVTRGEHYLYFNGNGKASLRMQIGTF